MAQNAGHLRFQNLKLNPGTICSTKSSTPQWVREVNASTSQLTGQDERIKKTYLVDHFLANKSRSQFGRICDQGYGHLSVTSPWGSNTNDYKKTTEKRKRNPRSRPASASARGVRSLRKQVYVFTLARKATRRPRTENVAFWARRFRMSLQ